MTYNLKMSEKFFQKNTPLEERRSELLDDPLVKKELNLISQDSELKDLYQNIIINSDFDKLREKSESQVSNLEKIYFSSISKYDIDALNQKIEKLASFTEFIERLIPIRADSNDYPEYKSPELTGEFNSYGPADVIVKSEQFVYGSFSKIGHLMSKSNTHDNIQPRILDVQDIAPRAQIIMNDVENVPARTKGGESYVQKYIENLFDYENGKKILALYLACIFDTPHEAEDLFSQAEGYPVKAQHWEQFLTYHNTHNEIHSTEDFLKHQAEDLEKLNSFKKKMTILLEDTGIEPPFSIEIRVKDYAKVLE